MLEDDLNDTQLVETASAVTSDLGQQWWLGDRDMQRCGTHFVVSIIDKKKDGDNAPLPLLEGHGRSLRCRPLPWIIGCHENRYSVWSILIKIDNCVESSSDDSWDN